MTDPILSALDQEIGALEARLAAAGSCGAAPERVILWAGPDEDPADAVHFRRPIRPDDPPEVRTMAAKYPNRTIIVRKLYASPMRRAGRPDTDGGHAVSPRMMEAARASDPGVPPADEVGADVVERATWRLARLRNEAQ